MNIEDIGLGINIAGSVIMLITIIVGAVKAWPYRKTDTDRFNAIYKPYKYWGFGIWLASSLIGILLLMCA